MRPQDLNGSSHGKLEPAHKVELVLDFLPQIYKWVREAHTVQPLTTVV